MVPVMVDNTPPVLTETFSSPKLTSADTVVSRFQKSTTLFLQATDNASGVAGIWYSLMVNVRKNTKSRFVSIKKVNIPCVFVHRTT
jgi:hypothetical protein